MIYAATPLKLYLFFALIWRKIWKNYFYSFKDLGEMKSK